LRIPNADRAQIGQRKLEDYLLSHTHPVGRNKAVFFMSLGYSASDWQRLEADLRSQHLPQDATATVATRFGQKYEIRAELVGPSGRTAEVVSVWIVRTNEDFPRLVTVLPGRRR
jgi:hypothetical protein